MEHLQPVLQFFSLEALDTRLYPPSDPAKKERVVARSTRSKWHTLEFKIYAVVFALAVPLMWKTAMDASNEHNPNYPKYEPLLTQGWMFGRKVDNSDTQYRFFRNNFWLLMGLVAGHVSLRKSTSLFGFQVKRTVFDVSFGFIYLFVLHGVNVLKIFFHLVVMYSFAKRIHDSKKAKILLWVYGIATLFVNDRYWDASFHFGILDNGFKGIITRWDVFYNFTLLRMLSFSLDYLEKKDSTSLGLKPVSDNLDDRERLTAPLPISEYNFFNYLAYITYAPLFIGGPIVTFNDYLYQTQYFRLKSTTDTKRIVIYGLRLLFCVLVMEFILHYMYVVAVSKTKAWDGDTPFQLSMLGMFNLNVIWLKLLIPWRLFRFWSLLDGVDPPENMIRCMDNNYSALAFWRAWHRSYNKWVIRYIYVPLGGGGRRGEGNGGSSGIKSRVANTLVVFSFVAVWHDIELKLLVWGWLVVLFLLPEILATLYFRKYSDRPWFRYLCGLGASINIWLMMIANLFGFCLGKDGTVALIKEMFSTSQGLRFFFFASATLFVGVQVMFEMREAEKRRGIDVKC
ncbi:hypothetical protein FT663_01035 [Candidozyma haemuli var. vulneris]|uniref:Glycerol uptake protein 1 n=1 Tax=Candidozyma haemuli TaxID=45357 RepID=A0A2V1AUR3_9ASCO|nr:hypothetical protein CXQ85_000238 [[Candida] haemuloni]KAF3990257.1 hypothetical protein FT662_02351 [[Candida] haemuloni var. vulneris]KAF3994805.1 hypothetical protein FT663_01035 [[Candida] haemuloni var. vulneris]PVH21266.1 hypothetical protein CXQ85_000238 [[Candida] haemuloni]